MREASAEFQSLPNQTPESTSPDAGKWLSANQIEKACNDLEAYWSSGTTQSSVEIDNLIRPALQDHQAKANNPQDRWYMPSSNVIKSTFLKVTRDCFVNGAIIRDTPFIRAPMEVCSSWMIERCLPEHVDNTKTSPIFGFMKAYTQFKVTPKFKGPFQEVLFPLWKLDYDLTGISEALGCILCSSYYDDAGFNPDGAGNVIQRGDARFSEGMKQVFGLRKHIMQDLREDHQKQLDLLQLYESIPEMPKLEKKIKDLELQNQKASVELESDIAKLESLKAELRALEIETETLEMVPATQSQDFELDELFAALTNEVDREKKEEDALRESLDEAWRSCLQRDL